MNIESRKYLRWINFHLKFRAIRGSDGFYIARRTVLPLITTIGRGTRINGPALVWSIGELQIGHYCACGHNIGFVTSNHSVGAVSLQHRLQRTLHIEVVQ